MLVVCAQAAVSLWRAGPALEMALHDGRRKSNSVGHAIDMPRYVFLPCTACTVKALHRLFHLQAYCNVAATHRSSASKEVRT